MTQTMTPMSPQRQAKQYARQSQSQQESKGGYIDPHSGVFKTFNMFDILYPVSSCFFISQKLHDL